MRNAGKYESPKIEITEFNIDNVIMEDHTIPITGNSGESIDDLDFETTSFFAEYVVIDENNKENYCIFYNVFSCI